jgi:hypothetical protein
MNTNHSKCLERIIKRCRGMTLADVDADLVVSMSGNPHAAILYQAARNLDAESVRRAEEDPVLNDVLGDPTIPNHPII